MFFYVTFREIILSGEKKVFPCKNLLCCYNTHLSMKKRTVIICGLLEYLYKLDCITKVMIQHILLHVTSREVFFTLNSCKSNYRIRD